MLLEMEQNGGTNISPVTRQRVNNQINQGDEEDAKEVALEALA